MKHQRIGMGGISEMAQLRQALVALAEKVERQADKIERLRLEIAILRDQSPKAQAVLKAVSANRVSSSGQQVMHILQSVADQTGVSVRDLKGKRRDKPTCEARFLAMRALRKAGGSLPWIGRVLGGRDHTTVLAGLKRAEEIWGVDSRG